MIKPKYDESSITIAKDTIDGIRMKPTMYIGSVNDGDGQFHLFKEIADNAVDEFLVGRNKSIYINIQGDSITVADAGQGIPVGIKEETGISTLVSILTKSHAGGKLTTSSTYSTSGSIGSHGIGLKACVALSEDFEIFTKREKQWYFTNFKYGKQISEVSKAKTPSLENGGFFSCGTIVTIVPDKKILKGSLDHQRIKDWCINSAFMNAGLEIILCIDNEKSVIYKSTLGIIEYVETILMPPKANVLSKDKLDFKNDKLDLALVFTDHDQCLVEAYTNTSKNAEGGHHLVQMFNALYQEIIPYTTKEFKLDDLKEGIIGAINYRIAAPQFDSNNKKKLVDDRVSKPCYETCRVAFKDFFNENQKLAKLLCRRAFDLKNLRLQSKETKDALMKITKSRKSRILLPGKLISSPKCDASRRELFLVEGDSSEGSCTRARNSSFQEVLPLRGKLMNALRAKSSQILGNEEVLNIFQAIGYDPSSNNPIDALRVSKVIFLADADVDGSHINVLLAALFYKYLPEMFDRGMIHVAKGYEYIIETPKKIFLADSLDEIRAQIPNQSLMKSVLHLKGWAEVSPEALAVMAFEPKTRRILKLNPLSEDIRTNFESLMSDNTEYRKTLLNIPQ